MQGWIELTARIIASFIIVGVPILIVIKLKEIVENFIYKKRRNEMRNNEVPQQDNKILDEEIKLETNNNKNEVVNQKYKNSYEPKYLMTLNEKAQFKKLQEWAQSRGVIVFSKVRLLDLITPRKEQDNYTFKSLLWKIQAKHVDFVICDQNIKTKCIVEINDNSHYRSDRQERDKFVVEVLQACGYKVLQTYNVTNEQLDHICGFIQSTTDEQNKSF